MKTQFFSAWEVYTKGARKLVADSGLDGDTEVWSGADGSLAIGDPADIYEADPDTDLDFYTYAGAVGEYKD